jgi:tetratricopeptide (TPR) repeat protein
MSRRFLFLLSATALAGCLAACAGTPAPPASGFPAAVPLYAELGSYHYGVSTDSPQAQQYFDQGMRLSYAFNHAEGIRAFQHAAMLDPQCAMCYWGVAYALGPNINAPITPEAAKAAWEAIGQARRASSATDKERAFIDALATRYAADPAADRVPLDKAYAAAMRALAARYPEDTEAATLYAQSLMDTSPWNYWDHEGKPREFTNDVLAALESVLQRQPNHIGAIHLYIHAVEASPDPKRAEPYADRLAALAPGAGHLVHMPGHIYLRTGRYRDASLANDNAVKADEAYLKANRVAGNMTYEIGYVPHNFHFFVTSASLEGRRADSLKAAGEVRARMHADMLRDPAMGGMVQHMTLAPLYTKVWFGMWDDVLAEPAPPEGVPFMTAMWQTARGLALVGLGRVEEAETARTAVADVAGDPSLEKMYVSSVNTASTIVAIAQAVLSGEIAATRRRAAEAIRHFDRAVALEDTLTYMEPPDWPVPVRRLQGAALLELGLVKDAEVAFRGDLRKFPDNGWSLSGLQASLERQGRTTDARAVQARFEEQWKQADIQVTAGRPVTWNVTGRAVMSHVQDCMHPDRRRTHIAMPPWADRRRRPARDIADLFVDGSAADAWAALTTQPISALVKPAQPEDEQVPVVDLASGQVDQDLEALASAFAIDEDQARS